VIDAHKYPSLIRPVARVFPHATGKIDQGLFLERDAETRKLHGARQEQLSAERLN